MCSFPADIECECFTPALFTFSVEDEQAVQEGDQSPHNRGTNLTDTDTSPGPALQLIEGLSENDLINKWCVVRYDDKAYPGIIQHVEETGVSVKCQLHFH